MEAETLGCSGLPITLLVEDPPAVSHWLKGLMLPSTTTTTKPAPKTCVYEEAEVVAVTVEARRRTMICYEKAIKCGYEDSRREICERLAGKGKKGDG